MGTRGMMIELMKMFLVVVIVLDVCIKKIDKNAKSGNIKAACIIELLVLHSPNRFKVVGHVHQIDSFFGMCSKAIAIYREVVKTSATCKIRFQNKNIEVCNILEAANI